MIFKSILFPIKNEIEKTALQLEEPDFFVDLNLDQIINAITYGRDEYNLKPFFYTSLNNRDVIWYRHEIMQDIENTGLFEDIKKFAENMRIMSKQLVLADKLYYKYQKERLFLDVVQFYGETLNSLAYDLSCINLKSNGFLAFREYLTNYILSNRFTLLLSETKKIINDLSTIRYCVILKDLCVQVRNYELEADYSAEVEATFDKFRQGEVKDYRVTFPDLQNMNDVEAKILDGVAQLHPDTFLHLDDFCGKYRNFQNETIAVFDREIQFYIAYLEYIAPLKEAELDFCYPLISNTKKNIYDYNGFDLALTQKLIIEKSAVVVNDFYLTDNERIFIVSGPNQGGKTTFARTFGQLHYLASIGCPVPGCKAQLFLYDKLFTHFEKEESILNIHSKLEDDLIRIYNIFNQANPNSIIIMNEILTSTTLQDSISLSKKIMEKIIQLDILCVWVTFIDELAAFSEKSVSMVSTVVPENPAIRTFKIIRKLPDGLAYAISIAEKYKLTYNSLIKRIKA